MTEVATRQLWTARIGFLIGIAVVAGLTWWATHTWEAVVSCVIFGVTFQNMYEVLSLRQRGKPAWNLRSLRFSIWHVMAATVLAAGFLALVRALFTAFPTLDRESLVMISVAMLFIYAMFCVVLFMLWVSVRNIRAVMRGDRIRYEDRLSMRLKKGVERRGDACEDDLGLRSIGP